MTEVTKRAGTALGERLSSLDERLAALHEGFQRDIGRLLKAQEEVANAHAGLARGVVEQAKEQAVLTQWMKDWTVEVNAWRKALEGRTETLERTQARLEQEASQARGAFRAAVWFYGAVMTLMTGVLSGLTVRLLGDVMGRSGT